MRCKSCGREATRLRVVWTPKKGGGYDKVEACRSCHPEMSAVLLFNYVLHPRAGTGGSPGARLVNRRGVSAAHVAEIRRRRVQGSFKDPYNPTFENYVDRGRVSVDMGRR